MLPKDIVRQLPYFVFVLAIFVTYGTLVRRGTIAGRNILWAGLLAGLIAVTSAFLNALPYLHQPDGLAAVVFNTTAMAMVSVYCVALTYRTQAVTDISTHTLGDTKVILRVCAPARIPDADALLLPTSTSLRMVGPLTGMVGMAVGRDVEKAALSRAPVGIGKVVETAGGRLAVGKIYHVAVHQPLQGTLAATLRKGIETAAQQARKGGAESLAVPLGRLSGLTPVQTMEALIEGALKHRKAFGEIVFVAFDARSGRDAEPVLERIVASLDGGAAPAQRTASS